jgi:hypothetical protein
MISPLADTIQEIDAAKRECLGLLSQLRQFHQLAAGTTNYPDTYRLLVIPLLYAAWQRCFTMCNAVAWRRLRDEAISAKSLTGNERAAWLMQAGFYQSFAKKLMNSTSIGTDEVRPKRSHFSALCDFLEELDRWSSSRLDAAIDTDRLVMTFSNVNPEVVAQNAKALGIANHPAFEAIKFGRLNSLVDLRNNIGHGGTILAPPNGEFLDLWAFTEQLIEDYSNAFKTWIAIRFAPSSPTFTERLMGNIKQILQFWPRSRAQSSKRP